jgi:two-component system response regulator RegX3
MLEFRLLELLMTHADHVLPTRRILDEIWGDDFRDDANTVAVQIVRLRKKLDSDPDAGQHLRTVRGLGYVFDTEPIRF